MHSAVSCVYLTIKSIGNTEKLVDILLVHALLFEKGLAIPNIVGPSVGRLRHQLEFVL